MEIKYSLSILFSNLGYIFKILLWLLFSVLISLAIGYAIVHPVWMKICMCTDASVYFNAIKSTLVAVFFNGVSFKSSLGSIVENIKNLLVEIYSQAGLATGLTFELIFINILFGLFFGLSFLPTSDIIDKFMTSNIRFGFASNFALNFKKSIVFSVEHCLFTLPINIINILIIGSAFLGLYPIILNPTIVVVLVLYIALTAFKNLLFAGWLPRVLYTQTEKIATSFSRSICSIKLNFKGLIKSFVLSAIIVCLFSSAFSSITCGLICLIIVPAYYFVIRAIELVSYFREKQFSFYTDSTNVINTIEFGYRKDNQDEEED